MVVHFVEVAGRERHECVEHLGIESILRDAAAVASALLQLIKVGRHFIDNDDYP
jgi:hypothetical protein